MTRILTRKHVEGLLTIREVIDAVELAHADLTNHLAIQPAPSTLSFDPSELGRSSDGSARQAAGSVGRKGPV